MVCYCCLRKLSARHHTFDIFFYPSSRGWCHLGKSFVAASDLSRNWNFRTNLMDNIGNQVAMYGCLSFFLQKSRVHCAWVGGCLSKNGSTDKPICPQSCGLAIIVRPDKKRKVCIVWVIATAGARARTKNFSWGETEKKRETHKNFRQRDAPLRKSSGESKRQEKKPHPP